MRADFTVFQVTGPTCETRLTSGLRSSAQQSQHSNLARFLLSLLFRGRESEDIVRVAFLQNRRWLSHMRVHTRKKEEDHCRIHIALFFFQCDNDCDSR